MHSSSQRYDCYGELHYLYVVPWRAAAGRIGKVVVQHRDRKCKTRESVAGIENALKRKRTG